MGSRWEENCRPPKGMEEASPEANTWEAFDSLPAAIRYLVDSGPYFIAPGDVAELIRLRGESFALYALRQLFAKQFPHWREESNHDSYVSTSSRASATSAQSRRAARLAARWAGGPEAARRRNRAGL